MTSLALCVSKGISDGVTCPKGILMMKTQTVRQAKENSKIRVKKRYDTGRCCSKNALSRWWCALRCTKTCRERSVAQREGGKNAETD